MKGLLLSGGFKLEIGSSGNIDGKSCPTRIKQYLTIPSFK